MVRYNDMDNRLNLDTKGVMHSPFFKIWGHLQLDCFYQLATLKVNFEYARMNNFLRIPRENMLNEQFHYLLWRMMVCQTGKMLANKIFCGIFKIMLGIGRKFRLEKRWQKVADLFRKASLGGNKKDCSPSSTQRQISHFRA